MAPFVSPGESFQSLSARSCPQAKRTETARPLRAQAEGPGTFPRAIA